LCNEFLHLPQRTEHHRKAGRQKRGDMANPRHDRGLAMQPSARPSIFRHGLSRRNGPLKSTRFYYPAKILELLSTTAMIMIRTPVFHLVRHAARAASPARVRAAQ
jgi:hypothetical protein